MQEQPITTQQPLLTSITRHVAFRPSVIVALALISGLVLPLVPILLGVLLIVAVALYTWSPDLRPYVDLLLRVPIVRPAKRRARLLLTAGAGVLLIVIGSGGATLRGQWRGEWEQRERGREAAEGDVNELLDRVRGHLSTGNVEAAELALMDADAIVAIDPDRREEIDELLERVRRSGDAKAILDILTRLPQEEFEALEKGTSVPAALEFEERALTYRAVELGLAQLEEARRLRARR